MKRSDFLDLMETLYRRYPDQDPFEKPTLNVMWVDLMGFEIAGAHDALMAVFRSDTAGGRRLHGWRPKPSEIVAAVREFADPDSALRQLPGPCPHRWERIELRIVHRPSDTALAVSRGRLKTEVALAAFDAYWDGCPRLEDGVEVCLDCDEVIPIDDERTRATRDRFAELERSS